MFRHEKIRIKAKKKNKKKRKKRRKFPPNNPTSALTTAYALWNTTALRLVLIQLKNKDCPTAVIEEAHIVQSENYITVLKKISFHGCSLILTAEN